MKSKIIILFLLLALITGCSCNHEWEEASCIMPRTCIECGATEGQPLAHFWTEASCTEPKNCTVCGTVEGNPIGHNWVSATCSAPKYCSVCQFSEGGVLEHQWTAASCTTPKSCSLCGLLEGNPTGHKWEDATCTKAMVCTFCGELAGDALGHDWKDATCTDPISCLICDETSGNPLGHTVESWSVSIASTCTEKGSEQGTCTICGETIEQELGLAEHSLGDWVVTVEPTENSEGTRTKSCTVCGKKLETEQFSLTPEEIAARYKERCQRISYDDLARMPDNYEGELVTFSGYVVQVCSEASSPLYYSTYRVATLGRYDNVVLIYVDNYGSEKRILEDDYITFYGKYDGLYSYTTVMGASKTIPSIKVVYVD